MYMPTPGLHTEVPAMVLLSTLFTVTDRVALVNPGPIASIAHPCWQQSPKRKPVATATG